MKGSGKEMNRISKLGITVVSVALASGSLAIAGVGVASASPRPAAVTASACAASAKNYPYPNAIRTYRAGAAGSVSVAPVNSGTIKVASVHPATGWRYFVDSSSGSSVDVYFHRGTHNIKFEAEINDFGGLTIRVTGC
jgi:hypothetical protein